MTIADFLYFSSYVNDLVKAEKQAAKDAGKAQRRQGNSRRRR